MCESLIKDSYKRTKRLSRSSSHTPSSASPVVEPARFARMIQHHQQQQQQRLLAARIPGESDQARESVDGTRYRIARSRSPMDVELPERRPTNAYSAEGSRAQSVMREEDKEEEGIVDSLESTGTVVVV